MSHMTRTFRARCRRTITIYWKVGKLKLWRRRGNHLGDMLGIYIYVAYATTGSWLLEFVLGVSFRYRIPHCPTSWYMDQSTHSVVESSLVDGWLGRVYICRHHLESSQWSNIQDRTANKDGVHARIIVCWGPHFVIWWWLIRCLGHDGSNHRVIMNTKKFCLEERKYMFTRIVKWSIRIDNRVTQQHDTSAMLLFQCIGPLKWT